MLKFDPYELAEIWWKEYQTLGYEFNLNKKGFTSQLFHDFTSGDFYKYVTPSLTVDNYIKNALEHYSSKLTLSKEQQQSFKWLQDNYPEIYI